MTIVAKLQQRFIQKVYFCKMKYKTWSLVLLVLSIALSSCTFQKLLKTGSVDEKYDEAVALVSELGQASISLVQRYMKIGYNRAARIIEKMESEGIVGPSDGAKARKVLIRKLPS